MNLGYCCLNMQLSYPKDYGSDNDRITMNRSMIRRTFDEKGLDYTSELVMKNCRDLFKIIQWNEDNDIKLFRMSSETFPWASEYYQDWDSVPQIEDIKQTLEYCGQLATKYGQRLTFHPGPFNVLVSPNEQVVQNTITDLSIHGDIMDFMGLSNEYTL
jgi:UV DNA damage endonuclease